MRIGHFDFTPGLWPTLVTLLLLPVLLGLGFWQLDRAEQKQELLETYDEHGSDAPIQLRARLKSTTGLRYRKATVTGRYDGAHQFLLDNRVYQGRAGYQVLTPLRIDGTDYAVLVNRGWTPQGKTRQDLPALPAPDKTELINVRGILYLPPEKVFALGEGEDRAYGWPKVLQKIEFTLHQQQLGYELLPVTVWLDPEQAHGFVREWKPLVFGPERHIGYAFQWFSLAFALGVIYILVNTRKAK